MDCCWLWISCRALSTRFRRALISSTESFSAVTWAEAWSSLLPVASCSRWMIFSSAPTVSDILLTESAFCWTRSLRTPMRSSLDCWSLATASWRSWIWVWSWTMSLLTAARAGTGRVVAARTMANSAIRKGERGVFIGFIRRTSGAQAPSIFGSTASVIDRGRTGRGGFPASRSRSRRCRTAFPCRS